MAGMALDVTVMKDTEEKAHAQAIQAEIHHRLLEQREQERLQIARDLHDGPTQELLAATYSLQEIIEKNEDPILKADLETLKEKIRTHVKDLRSFSGQLRPPALDHFGLFRAIQSHAQEFEQKHPEIHIHVEEDRIGELVPKEMRLALFRIYQEALNNVARHARATRVDVRLVKGAGSICLEIEDNGKGYTPPADWLALARQGHLGLVGMRERAEAVGGQLSISANPEGGTNLKVEISL